MKTKNVLALALLAASAASWAQSPSPYVGLMGSYLLPDEGRPGGDDKALGAAVVFGFPVGRYLAPELNFSWSRQDNDLTGRHDDNYALGLDLRLGMAPSARVNPFLLLGGGGVSEDANTQDSEIVGYANAGGGLLVPLGASRRASLRLEGRRYATFTDAVVPGSDRVWDTRVNLGLEYAFRGSPPAPTPVPLHPVPPEVVDSDRDRVPDRIDRCPGTVPGVEVNEFGCPLPPADADADGVVDLNDFCPDTPRGLRVDSRGCVFKAQTLVLRNINFEYNKATLTEDSRGALDEIARGLIGQPTMQVSLEGHTDDTGGGAYNLSLSRARANAVRDYLVSQGVAADRLSAQGYGEENPVADNLSEEGRAQNRRVEFKVVQQ